jgi:serine/threonine-protein kinase
MPDLIVAMARWRLGEPDKARAALARAIASYDWSPAPVDEERRWIRHVLVRAAPRNPQDGDPWLYHVLRREAEAMIVPDLPAYLDGRYEPRDANERLAMTGACEFLERHAAHARLWAAAYASDPAPASESRGRAVRAAVLAGCGRGNDAASLTDAARAALRAQARQWFGAELDAVGSEVPQADAAAAAAKERAIRVIRAWDKAPELTEVREAGALARLPAEEAREWGMLWDRAAVLLGRQKRATWTYVPPPPPVSPAAPATQNSERPDLSKKK